MYIMVNVIQIDLAIPKNVVIRAGGVNLIKTDHKQTFVVILLLSTVVHPDSPEKTYLTNKSHLNN